MICCGEHAIYYLRTCRVSADIAAYSVVQLLLPLLLYIPQKKNFRLMIGTLQILL